MSEFCRNKKAIGTEGGPKADQVPDDTQGDLVYTGDRLSSKGRAVGTAMLQRDGSNPTSGLGDGKNLRNAPQLSLTMLRLRGKRDTSTAVIDFTQARAFDGCDKTGSSPLDRGKKARISSRWLIRTACLCWISALKVAFRQPGHRSGHKCHPITDF